LKHHFFGIIPDAHLILNEGEVIDASVMRATWPGVASPPR